MSMKTLPLVFINLGGEMLYILDQRLRANNSTSEDNSEKGLWTDNDRKRVMNDITATMYSRAFMEELLKPQQLYSHRTMKTVLTRLAHSSIMRLSPASMDRLYELMVMAFKYQIFHCPRPKDLLLISYNHIDTIREFVKDTPVVLNQVDDTHRKIIEVYTSLPEAEFQLLRQTLLIFFQDMHVRVSHFLRHKIQNPNGRFALSTSGPVPHRMEVPGLIRTFDHKGREVKRSLFPTGGSYTSPIREGSFELHGNRVIGLGTNMYTATYLEDMTQTSKTKSPAIKTDDTPNLLAKEELNLLARLMGGMDAGNTQSAETGFRINLFPTGEEAGSLNGRDEPLYEIINIQAMQDEQATTELARIAGEFADQGVQQEEVTTSNKGDDLLAMMDNMEA